MNYQIKNDQPIQSKEEDILGRDFFAENLANVLVNYTRNQLHRNGLVVGVEGEWGSGKTSFFNLLKKHLQIYEGFDIKDLNSWMTTDKEGLSQEFLNSIVNFYQSNHNVSESVKKYAKSFLSRATQSLTLHIKVPYISEAEIDMGKALEGVFENDSLTKQKDELNAKLKVDDGNWLILFIDDIDRLSYQEIGTLFQLIKNVADFPGVIYVLAYDKEVVINALDNVQRDKGADYLQKVVQLTYTIPAVRVDDLSNYFIQQLEKVIPQSIIETEFNQMHLQEVYYFFLKFFLKTIRDCKRLINAFVWKYYLCGKNCDFADLLTITTLEVFEPKVYQMIRQHKSFMLTRNSLGMGLDDVEKEELRKFYNRIKSSFNLDKQRYADILFKNIFPSFYTVATKKQVTHATNQTFEISNPESFDRYFSLTIKSDEIPIEEINHFVENVIDKDKIQKQLQAWNAEGRLGYFFEQLLRILYENKQLSAYLDGTKTVFYLEAFSLLHVERGYGLYQRDPMHLQMLFINNLIHRVIYDTSSGDDKDELLEKIFENRKINCSLLFYVLRGISDGYQWDFDNQDRSALPTIIEKESFDKFEKLFLRRIKEEITNGKFYEEPFDYNLICFWKEKEPKSYKEFLHQDNIEPLQLAYHLQLGISFLVPDGEVEKRRYYLIPELITDFDWQHDIPVMQKFIKSKQFNELTEEIQQKIIALCLIWQQSEG